MSDRLRISRTWAQRFAEQKLAVPMLLRRAGLPPGLFQQETVYVTTAELFALWRAVGEMTSDPAIGLRLGAETRFERSHPAAIAVMCSRTFADALERLGRYKKLTCPEEIRVHKKAQEAAVEFFYVAERNALVFRSSDLDRPFVTHNDELLTVIGTQLDSETAVAVFTKANPLPRLRRPPRSTCMCRRCSPARSGT